ncbi:EamA family transporter [Amnibacterium endophyticum]|uniref:DMT family transporter n=1 Tax=Amnibacterium endophyticum TaxID=2109337 RepID=A0ABW4LBT2_9MICO
MRKSASSGSVALVAASAGSLQTGAAFGATLFPLVGPLGVVALRQLVTAVVLLALTRPPLARIGLRALLPAVLLGVVLVGMNLTLYSAVERIGLGLAVTIEFVGPLGVALAVRGSGALRRSGAAFLALVGVVLVTDPAASARPDAVGIAFALGAATLWAAYILLNQRVGSLPGLTGTAVAGLVGTVLTLPALVLLLSALPPGRLPQVLAIGALTGLLSSALPYSLDLLVLRRIPRSLFGVLQSVHPVAAALAGLVVLHQALVAPQVAGIALVCAANVVAVVRRDA